MARKSIVEVLAEVTILLADNTTGDITPADVRTVFTDILEIIQPSYGVLEIPTPSTVVKTVELADSPLVWTASLVGGVTQYTTADNSVISCDKSASSRIDLTMNIEGPNGRLVIATLYKNGVATPLVASGNTLGAGKPVSLNFSGIQYSDGVTTYELRVKADVAGTSVTFSNSVLLLSNLPVNSYV